MVSEVGFAVKEDNCFLLQAEYPILKTTMYKFTTPKLFGFTNQGIGKIIENTRKDNIQFSKLIYCIGNKAENMFRTFSFS